MATVESQLHIPLNPSTYEENGASETIYNDADYSSSTSSSHLKSESSGFFNWMRNVEDSKILRYMRYINVLLALFQGLTGFLGLFDLIVLNLESFLVAAYVIIFSLILLTFECRFQSMEPMLRSNFGFLFTYQGRTIFLFFIGGLDFAMSNHLAWLAGVLMCLNACFHLSVLLCHPSFRDGRMNGSMDPTCNYNMGEHEAREFLLANPQIAKKAGSFAFQQAQKNPQLAVQFAQSQLDNRKENYPYVAPSADMVNSIGKTTSFNNYSR